MTDTVRAKCIKALKNRLSTITVENDYNYDCGLHVFRAAKTIPDDLGASVILWPGLETASYQYGYAEIASPVRCEANTTYDATAENSDELASEIQDQLLGDLVRCMTRPDVRYPAGTPAITLSYQTGGPAETPGEQDKCVAVFAEFQLKYKHKKGDPYTEPD